MLKHTILLLLAAMPVSMQARQAVVSSPNQQLTITVSDEGDCATYRIDFQGQQVLLPSALGLKTNFGDFTQRLTITGQQTGSTRDSYQMRQVKQSTISYEANTLTVDLENNQHQKLQVEFFVKDNDVAFRYLIPRQEKDNPKCGIVERESTSFRLTDGTTTFLCPQIDPMQG